jgi:hypothetical protein
MTTKWIPWEVLEDLQLWLDFLKQQGYCRISLNILTIQVPTLLYRADSCKHGIGGLNLIKGHACRFEIPEDLRHRATLPEHFGLVRPWIGLLEGNVPTHYVLTAQQLLGGR